MRQLFNWPSRLLIMQLMLLGLSSQAQNIVRDAQGNYKSVKATKDSTISSDIKTEHTFTDSKGNIWPVYHTKTGRVYALRVSKSGTKYKQYMDRPANKPI